MTEVVTTANQSNFLSRQEMLQWINDSLKLNEKKIENLGTGAIYCQLFDLVYPGKVQMAKVNWKAKYENEYVSNFKILQQAFDKMNVNKPIDVNKLIKCKYQDNLEFLQWMKKYHDQFRKNQDKPYDAVGRRNGQVLLDRDYPNDKIPTHPHFQAIKEQASTILDNSVNHSSKHNFSRHSNKKSQTHFVPSDQGKQMSHSCQSSISNLSIDNEFNHLDEADAAKPYPSTNKIQSDSLIERLKDERNFYFSKIQSIDQMLDNISDKNPMTINEIKKYIKTILYSTQDQILNILEDGTVTLADKQLNNLSINQFESMEGLEQLKKEILSTDQFIKNSAKKNKKKNAKTYDNNQENKNTLLVPQHQQSETFSNRSNQGFKTPKSSKYSYEQSLQLDDFTSSIISNTNNNFITFNQNNNKSQQIQSNFVQSKKDSEPLYEIFINEEQNQRNRQNDLLKNQSQNSYGDLIKIQQVSELQLPNNDVFELNQNLLESQDEDLLGNLE
ncbi:hypothetical protein ABPG74_009324 [Tetrahymena malaccensis]